VAITKSELILLFNEKARPNGWKVKEAIFPPHGIETEFFPERECIFKALELLRPEDVRYVILGQDPYYDTYDNNMPIATGVAFGVERTAGIKPSCAIFKVLKGIYGNDRRRRQYSNLACWSRCKGVLLLNAALTVQPGPVHNNEFAGGHIDRWHDFVTAIVRQVDRKNVAMIAWGVEALDLMRNILGREPNLSCNHPSASTGSLGKFSDFWCDSPLRCAIQ